MSDEFSARKLKYTKGLAKNFYQELSYEDEIKAFDKNFPDFMSRSKSEYGKNPQNDDFEMGYFAFLKETENVISICNSIKPIENVVSENESNTEIDIELFTSVGLITRFALALHSIFIYDLLETITREILVTKEKVTLDWFGETVIDINSINSAWDLYVLYSDIRNSFLNVYNDKNWTWIGNYLPDYYKEGYETTINLYKEQRNKTLTSLSSSDSIEDKITNLLDMYNLFASIKDGYIIVQKDMINNTLNMEEVDTRLIHYVDYKSIVQDVLVSDIATITMLFNYYRIVKNDESSKKQFLSFLWIYTIEMCNLYVQISNSKLFNIDNNNSLSIAENIYSTINHAYSEYSNILESSELQKNPCISNEIDQGFNFINKRESMQNDAPIWIDSYTTYLELNSRLNTEGKSSIFKHAWNEDYSEIGINQAQHNRENAAQELVFLQNALFYLIQFYEFEISQGKNQGDSIYLKEMLYNSTELDRKIKSTLYEKPWLFDSYMDVKQESVTSMMIKEEKGQTLAEIAKKNALFNVNNVIIAGFDSYNLDSFIKSYRNAINYIKWNEDESEALEEIYNKVKICIEKKVETDNEFNLIKGKIISSIGLEKLSTKVINTLTTAEYLYKLYVDNHEKMDGFDYGCISVLYYQAFESAYRELIIEPYINYLQDSGITIIKEGYNYILSKSGYWDYRRYSAIIDKNGNFTSLCMYNDFANIMKKAGYGDSSVLQFSNYLSKVMGNKYNQGNIAGFASDVFDAKTSRNDASHGGRLISYNEVQEDKKKIYVNVPGQNYKELLIKLISFFKL